MCLQLDPRVNSESKAGIILVKMHGTATIFMNSSRGSSFSWDTLIEKDPLISTQNKNSTASTQNGSEADLLQFSIETSKYILEEFEVTIFLLKK